LVEHTGLEQLVDYPFTRRPDSVSGKSLRTLDWTSAQVVQFVYDFRVQPLIIHYGPQGYARLVLSDLYLLLTVH
jgi:hypothetical protein